jgi:hypothetical protein
LDIGADDSCKKIAQLSPADDQIQVVSRISSRKKSMELKFNGIDITFTIEPIGHLHAMAAIYLSEDFR